MTRLASIALTAVMAGSLLITAGPVYDSFRGDALNLALWCPTHITKSLPGGCFRIEPSTAGRNRTVAFDPARVRVRGGNVVFTIRRDPYAADGITYPYRSGSVNGKLKQAYGYGMFTVRAQIPCNARGRIEDWPAIWVTGTTGPWPLHGEIDILEGLGGRAEWHYHYLNADGQAASVGAAVPGDWCGWHTFAAYRTATYLTIRYDGHTVGRVTPAEIGVPLAADPMTPVINLNASLPGFCCGGPFDPGAVMRVGFFRYTPE